MKSLTALASAIVLVAGLGFTASALADVSPCSKPDGWFKHGKAALDCQGLSHYYHCTPKNVVYCSGKKEMKVNIKKIFHHGKYVENQKADKATLDKYGKDMATACADLYKKDL